MKTNIFSIGIVALTLSSCGALNNSPGYSDDIYFDAKKPKTEQNPQDSYSSSPTYEKSSSQATSSQSQKAPLKSAGVDNRDFSGAQNYYSEQMNDSIAAENGIADSPVENEVGADQSYAQRIVRFHGGFSGTPYYSDVYTSVVDPYSGDVDVYVDNSYYNPWYHNYYGSSFGAYWGNGWGLGFGYGWNSPYYGYGNSYYGYGNPYCGYGYSNYGYGGHGGGYYPHHNGGGWHNNDNYTSGSSQNYHYGPRPGGGSTYTNRSVSPSNGSNSFSRSPRSGFVGGTYKSASTVGQYSRPNRSSSYQQYSRPSQNAVAGGAVNSSPVSTPVRETTYRRSYTPNYVQPSNNARPQYNSTSYSRPTGASTRPERTQQSSFSRTPQSTFNSGSSVAPIQTSPPAQNYNRSSYSNESSGNSGSRSYNSGSNSGGGGYSAPSTPSAPSNSGHGVGGGGSRAPRR